MDQRRNKVHPEGCICEQFAYLRYLAVYPNSSDMNELAEIPPLCVNRSGVNGKV